MARKVHEVARAIAMNVYGGYPVYAEEWAVWAHRERCESAAHAAIEAMREPDRPMVAAGLFAVQDTDDEHTYAVHWRVWAAMIDAALTE